MTARTWKATGFPSVFLMKLHCECIFSILCQRISDKAENPPQEIIFENKVLYNSKRPVGLEGGERGRQRSPLRTKIECVVPEISHP